MGAFGAISSALGLSSGIASMAVGAVTLGDSASAELAAAPLAFASGIGPMIGGVVGMLAMPRQADLGFTRGVAVGTGLEFALGLGLMIAAARPTPVQTYQRSPANQNSPHLGMEFLDDGVASKRPVPPDILMDSDVVISAMNGDTAALSLLRRYGGRSAMTGRSVGEALGNHGLSRKQVMRFVETFGVRFVKSQGSSRHWVATRLERPGKTHWSDMILLGTAKARSMKFVTFGDGSAAAGGIALGLEVRIISPGARALNKIMNAITGRRLDPTRYQLSTAEPL